ncbi:YbaK/EbsC family protein [Spirochaeta cellobiosiphila]|uniref:YbaK/EbsC family protein n=1 Tax=Spirochaeta cellobiosiphila TaxID=504483 RepID=UPI00040E5B5B|nr:YbaK/EbsC family protein [Spirochaeta cellobiosiphila]
MSIINAREHLSKWNREQDILEFDVSSATVELAAKALNCDQARIAKTLTYKLDNRVIMIVAAGDARVDNKKYKAFFEAKAKMLHPEEVETLVGHQIGGVCPFGVKKDVEIYLDKSLKRFDSVFPACGSSHSAIELSCQELETYSESNQWIDVCKDWQ